MIYSSKETAVSGSYSILNSFVFLPCCRIEMAGVTAAKAFTGLTGLTVAKNPTHTLGVLYSKTLRALAKVKLSTPVNVKTNCVRLGFLLFLH